MLKNRLLLIFLLALLFRIVFSFLAWHPDVNNHIDWGIRFYQYGARGFFSPDANVWNFTWPNQPPGTIYIYAFVRKLFELIFSIFWWININIPIFPSVVITFFEKNLYPSLLKLPSILADLGIAYVLYKIFAEKKKAKTGEFAAMLFLFNPVIWYNSSVWGQTDSLINLLALLSFYFLNKKRLTISIFLLGLSLYIKISLVIFAPIFLIYAFNQKFKVKEWLLGIGLTLAFIWIATIPFSGINAPSWLYELYTHKVLTNQLQVITANAFNFWAALTGIYEQPHTKYLGPFQYQHWGTFLFSLIFIPLLYKLYKKHNSSMLWLTLAITSFASFMFMTNMHERYLYPLFPYFTLIAAEYSSFRVIYYIVSIISLSNLYHLWWMPRVEVIVSIFSAYDRLLPRILGLINFAAFILFLRKSTILFKDE